MYTLHKLPEGFIVTSDEQAKEGELGYIPFEDGDIKTVGKYFADDWKKVIAQQHQIDFSALSEEEQKEIGWFDVEKLADNKYPLHNILHLQLNTAIKTGYQEGFQKAQELLSDRRFTLDNMELLAAELIGRYRLGEINDVDDVKKIIESHSQPKSWSVEGEWNEDKFNLKKLGK
jgi:hypothetical protein